MNVKNILITFVILTAHPAFEVNAASFIRTQPKALKPPQISRQSKQFREAGTGGIGELLMSATRSLNGVIGAVREMNMDLTDAVEAFADLFQIERSGMAAGRQAVDTVSSVTNLVSGTSDSVGDLVEDFTRDGADVLAAFDRFFDDLTTNLRNTYSAGGVQVAGADVNIFDVAATGISAGFNNLVESIGMQVAYQRLQALMADFADLGRVTSRYQRSVSDHLASFTAGTTTSTGRNTFFANILTVGSNVLRGAAGIITESAVFAESFTAVASRAFDDMHKLESDFTKAWIQWFPEEWGFDGTLSGWYNVGRLVAALSRRIAESQGTANDVVASLNTGSKYLRDAAGIASVVEAGLA